MHDGCCPSIACCCCCCCCCSSMALYYCIAQLCCAHASLCWAEQPTQLNPVLLAELSVKCLYFWEFWSLKSLPRFQGDSNFNLYLKIGPIFFLGPLLLGNECRSRLLSPWYNRSKCYLKYKLVAKYNYSTRVVRMEIFGLILRMGLTKKGIALLYDLRKLFWDNSRNHLETKRCHHLILAYFSIVRAIWNVCIFQILASTSIATYI